MLLLLDEGPGPPVEAVPASLMPAPMQKPLTRVKPYSRRDRDRHKLRLFKHFNILYDNSDVSVLECY